MWDSGVFIKKQVSMSDYFVLLEGIWVPSQTPLLIITVYAPNDAHEKRMLWDYMVEKNW